MALVTGTAYGNIDAQEDLFLEGAPTIYIQDSNAGSYFAPDADGFYWQLSGTSTYPVYEIGCITDVSLADNLTLNDVLCDSLGVKDTILQRNYVEFNFTVQSFFPFQVLRVLIGGGAVTETNPTQKFGLGKYNNAQFWHVYAPKVYDEIYGDYVAIYLHKCKFVDPWTINMSFGAPWQLTGLKLRAFVDSTKPAAQQFGVMVRADDSAIPFSG